jgi:hypothetical protein
MEPRGYALGDFPTFANAVLGFVVARLFQVFQEVAWN